MKDTNNDHHTTLSVDEHGVAILSIRNAGHLNILSTPVINALRTVIEKIGAMKDVRVLVLRGEGDKAFVAGADIKEMVNFDYESAQRFIDGLRQLCDSVRNIPQPVIARIPGWCLGGGLELALACDIRIGTEQTRLGMPEVKVGIPSIIHAALLPRLIGQSRANWMLLTGEIIDADESLIYGLLNRLVQSEDLDKEVTRVAQLLAEFGPTALAQQKRLLREWESEPLEKSILNGVKEFASAFATGEPQQFMGEFIRAKQNKG